MPDITHDLSMDIESEIGSDAPASSEQLDPEQAVRQFEAGRRFKISTAAAAGGVTLLVPIWAATEYRNAGGWPTRGFGQRSGVRNVWNVWIIYPVISLACMTAVRGWFVYGRAPVSDAEIQRAMKRQTGSPR